MRVRYVVPIFMAVSVLVGVPTSSTRAASVAAVRGHGSVAAGVMNQVASSGLNRSRRCHYEPDHNDRDDRGLSPAANDYDRTCIPGFATVARHIAEEYGTMIVTRDPWYLYDMPNDATPYMPTLIRQPVQAVLNAISPVADLFA